MKEMTFDRRRVNSTGPLVRGLYCPSSQKLIRKALHEITVVKAILILSSYRSILNNVPTAHHYITWPHGRAQKIFQGWGNIYILLIFFRLLTMQYKRTFTKRFTLSTPLVCIGLTSILSFVWNGFYTSAIRNAFSFHKPPKIHFIEHFLQISHNVRIINDQNNMSGEKTRKLGTLAKLFQAVRSRSVYWQDYQTAFQS